MFIGRIYTTPGKLIKKYLAANEVSQTRLAELTGYSEKQISLILSDRKPVTERFADALETALPGSKKGFWLRYYENYEKQHAEDEKLLHELHYDEWAQKCSFKKLFAHDDLSKLDQIKEVQRLIGSSNISAVDSYQFAYSHGVSFLREDKRYGAANQTLLNLWLGLASSSAQLENESLDFVGKSALMQKLYSSKKLFMVSDSKKLIQCIQFFAADCGIKVIFTDSAPTTYVRGATFSDNGMIYILLTSRYKTVEFTLFAFVHELFHIINEDITPSGRKALLAEEDQGHEDNISLMAKRFFIEEKSYRELLSGIQEKIYGASDIFRFAQQNETTPGMIVTFLQRDTQDYSTYRQYLHRFTLDA